VVFSRAFREGGAMHDRIVRAATRCLLAAALLLGATTAHAAFTTFETGQVRPLAMSPDGTRLFAVNTPDDRLEIFTIGAGGSLTHSASVAVGLEPCAVAARTDGEVWVVNHLSDSISIVDVAAAPPRVVRTLLVGDEPRDLVFAGGRAFVTTAHRGQNSPVDPQLTTEGVGRADVWVFDPAALGAALGGQPVTIVTLFGDTPRALAASPDGTRVYAAVFHSGNQTTALSEGLVCNGGAAAPACNVFGFSMPGGLPAPNRDANNVLGPETGLIVQFDQASSQWRDQLGRNWNNAVRFSLPDLDVFEIDAAAAVPVEAASWAHVGTILFNMVVNPASGRVYVTNTDAHNEVRFEGDLVAGATTVQGHLHEARITVLDGGAVIPRHLNKHIDYAITPAPPGIKDDSLSIPLGMAVNAAGTTLYVAAFGSGKVGVFDTAQLEADTFVPDGTAYIPVSGGGPSGVVLDEARGRLYVMTRFDDGVSVVDTTGRQEIAHLTFHNPEPANVVDGRPVFYDAVETTSNGESPCASCHVFGDFDSLAWDLGNPGDVVFNNPNPILLPGLSPTFHPLKGPMTTQSLRGMANHGPMHWRGDRTAGNDPGGDPLDERGGFLKFIVAFHGLLGRDGPISGSAMGAFADFILDVTYPPNPVRNLDNTLTAAQQAGRNLYFGPTTDGFANCNGCHTLNEAQGFFGTSGETTFENEPQLLKVPHLRNMYQKVGMFGMPQVPFLRAGNNGPLGDQVRGFGFLHDGSIDTLFRFHGATVFSTSEQDRADLEAFMMAFPTNLAPIVGQQITIGPGSPAVVGQRVDLLIQRAAQNECEVVVKGNLGSVQRGWVRLASGLLASDRQSEATVAEATVRAQAGVAGQERTYTCVPPGSGERIGVDRDGDGFFDRTELDAGSDPADPTSIPSGATTTTTPSTTTTTVAASSTTTTTTTATTSSTTTTAPPPTTNVQTTALRLKTTREGGTRLSFRSATKRDPAANRIVAPARGGPDDPTLAASALFVYNSAGTQEIWAHSLVTSGWRRLGSDANPRGYKYIGRLTSDLQVRSIVIRDDRITVRAFPGVSLDETSQGRIATRLSLGLSTYCADAPAKLAGHPPSTARNDTVGKFVAQPKTPAPGVCPPIP
jgi:DNA-binding beta-propeller fold protein YncE